jgi:hypothetical protein
MKSRTFYSRAMRRLVGILFAFLMAVGTVAEAPFLAGHAATHSLERAIQSTSKSHAQSISNPECDLCHAYTLQNTFISVSIEGIAFSSAFTSMLHLADASGSPTNTSFFRARAPPCLLLNLNPSKV